eukprot:PRCOL_00000879-RA
MEDGPEREVVYENTYIQGPDGYGQDKKFRKGRVQKVVTELVKSRLDGLVYDPVRSAQVAKELSDVVKEKVKDLGYDRYKLIVQVTVGQKVGQAMRIASRCLWDTNTDNCASDYYENETTYCVCMVYGLYLQ